MRLLKLINGKFEEIFLVVILVIMVVLVFLQVCMRYVFQASLSWSEELARYMFLWIIWVGAAYATKEGSHISLDIITSRLPRKGQILTNALKYIIWIAFTIFLAYISWQLTFIIFERGQVSAAMRIPMGFAYASIPTGITLMLIRLIQNGIKVFKERGQQNG